MINKIKNIFTKQESPKKKIINNSKYFTGASTKREDGLTDFDTQSINFRDEQFFRELIDIRSRSYKAYYNYPLATSIINCFIKYTSPIKFQSKIYKSGISEDQTLEINRFIEKLFNKKFSPNIDFNGEYNFKTFQKAVRFQRLIFGECFVQRLTDRRDGVVYKTKYQIIPPDMVVQPSGINTNNIWNGIEFDSNRRPTAVYILKDPAFIQYKNVYNVYPREQLSRVNIFDSNGEKKIYHLYDKHYPWQYRGIPILTPVLKGVHDLKKYNDSEWFKKRLLANIVYFHKSANPNRTYMDTLMVQDEFGDEVEIENYNMSMEPGEIIYGSSDDDLKIIDSDNQDSNYQAFINHNIELIGAALSIAPFLISGNYSNINYSSARSGLIATKNVFKDMIENDVDDLYNHIIDNFIKESIENKYIDGLTIDELEYTFIPPRIELMDLQKEVSAYTDLLEHNIVSRKEIASMLLNTDIDETLDELKTEDTKLNFFSENGQIDKE